jgi:hypothetical protein
VIPVVWEWHRHRRNGRRDKQAAERAEEPEPATESVEG